MFRNATSKIIGIELTAKSGFLISKTKAPRDNQDQKSIVINCKGKEKY